MPALDDRIGISVSSQKIQVVEVGFQDGGRLLNHIDEAILPSPLNFTSDKEAVLLSGLQSAFNILSERTNLKNRQVSIALPPEFFYSFTVPADQTIVRQDLIDNFRWEFAVLFPFLTAEDYSLNYYEIDRPGSLSKERRVIVFALSRKIINLLIMVCKRNNLEIKLIDHSHFSADKSLLMNRPELLTGALVSACISSNYFSIEYLDQGRPQYFNGRHFDSTQNFLAAVTEELQAITEAGYNLNKLENFFLTGDSLSEPLLSAVRGATRHPFQMLNPFSALILGGAGLNKELLHSRNYNFNSAAGLCYRLI